MSKVIGLVVSYDTPELLAQALDSINLLYPDMIFVIVDGSPVGSDCHLMTQRLRLMAPFKYNVINLGYNIGHGPGMDMGLRIIRSSYEAEYVLIFDSDIRMTGKALEPMLEQIGDNYGIGQVIRVDSLGVNSLTGYKYLHPHFCLISLRQYFSYPPFIHHGAPLLKAMKAAPKIRAFAVGDYVQHRSRGTRDLSPLDFLKNWEN